MDGVFAGDKKARQSAPKRAEVRSKHRGSIAETSVK
jgi:hypothetical protein